MSQTGQAADTVMFGALNKRKKETEADLKGNALCVQDTRWIYTRAPANITCHNRTQQGSKRFEGINPATFSYCFSFSFSQGQGDI